MNGKKGFIGFSYAWNGLKIIIKERNFRIHLIATLLVIGAGLYFKLNKIEWSIVMIVVSIVLISEIFNSVIEQTINHVKPEIHPTAKMIKDMAAAGVLVAAIIAIFIGLIIFLPKIVYLLP